MIRPSETVFRYALIDGIIPAIIAPNIIRIIYRKSIELGENSPIVKPNFDSRNGASINNVE